MTVSSHDKAQLSKVNQVKFIYTSSGTFYFFFCVLSILHEACAVTGALVCGRNSVLTLLSGSYILPSIARIHLVADNRTVYVKMIRYVHNADRELHTGCSQIYSSTQTSEKDGVFTWAAEARSSSRLNRSFLLNTFIISQ